MEQVMIIGIQGTKSFNDYSNILLRAMHTALSDIDPEDKDILVACAGPRNIALMAMEFVNVSFRNLKARGIKIKTINVPESWIKKNIHEISYFAFFCKPKEPLSDLVAYADAKDVDNGVYRF